MVQQNNKETHDLSTTLTIPLHQTLLCVIYGPPQPRNEVGQLRVLFVSDIKRAIVGVVAPQILKVVVPQLIRYAPNESNLLGK